MSPDQTNSRPLLLANVRPVALGATPASAFDILIGADGRIAQVGSSLPVPPGAQMIDAKSAWCSTGWVDLHAHVWRGGTDISLDPSQCGVPRGVATIVDAGSAGEANFSGFREFIIEKARERIKVFLNLGSIGLVACGRVSELVDMRSIDIDRTIACVEANRDVIAGLKVRASGSISGTWGLTALKIGKRVAKNLGLPLTGRDPALIERLPDTMGLKNEVPILAGHMINYGAPIAQGIALTGARVVPVGQATFARRYHLEGAIGEHTACAVYVVSHHCVDHGLMPLDEFAAVCHARGIPVIVDAASEYDLRTFIEQGSDVVLYSAQKFLGGPTAGIVAGTKELVRCAYLQNIGIGRSMKVGKEGVVGTIAALQAWKARDHEAVRRAEAAYLALWQGVLAGRPGIVATIAADPTGNPLDRLQIQVCSDGAKITAWDLADALAAGDPAVSVRDHEAEHGTFSLDPCCLHPGEEDIVARRLTEELDRAQASHTVIATPLERRRNRRIESLMRWPD